MFFSELKPKVRYVVTVGNDTLHIGDKVSLDKGDLILHNNGGGWLVKDDCAEWSKGAQFKVDNVYYNRLRQEIENAY